MLALEFERTLGGRVELDFCFPCQVIWFDQHESTQLAPSGVLGVFRALNEHRTGTRNSLAGLLNCPRCNSRLNLTQDLQHTTHFSYYRCEWGHGRLTPFLQFLREKDFIRPVSGTELAALKAKVRMIQCSNCGAPVDLEHDIACAYCHTPISILDPDAVAETVDKLATAEARRESIDVDALADALLLQPPPDAGSQWAGRMPGADLVAVGVGIIASLLR
jgi:DNA-directed RNA polymerase subunit RPC12/RpoP